MSVHIEKRKTRKEERDMASVKLSKVIEKMKLENLTPDIDITNIRVTQPDINRPALQMAGFFAHGHFCRGDAFDFVALPGGAFGCLLPGDQNQRRAGRL